MRKIIKTYVGIEAGQMHCRIMEGCEPSIVFLHQTASSSACFEPTMAALTCPNRLIALDTPGFGGSFKPAGWPSMELYAQWMLETFAALSLARVHLFGHHTGASLAVEIAVQAPEIAASLMLAGPVLMTAAERVAFAAKFSAPVPLARDGSHLLTNWNYAATYNPGCDLEILHAEVVAMLVARIGRAQAYQAVAGHDLARLINGVSQPVLLVTSPDDYSHASFDLACQAFPDARCATVGGGNFQPTADPAGVAAAIEDFLATIAP